MDLDNIPWITYKGRIPTRSFFGQSRAAGMPSNRTMHIAALQFGQCLPPREFTKDPESHPPSAALYAWVRTW